MVRAEHISAEPCTHNLNSHTIGDRFLDLPAEIQTSILAYLSVTELLSLRITSKQCHAIFQANGTTIARNTFLATFSNPTESGTATTSTYSPAFLLDLYPSTFSSTTTDAYFLRTLRRSSLIKAQLDVLLTFIQTRVYMLRLNAHLDVQHFSPYRSGLFTRLFKPLGYIQHLLESIRHIIIHIHPSHSPTSQSTIDTCPSCNRTIEHLVSTYPPETLVDIHSLLTLTLQHLRAATRSPSTVTSFERKLRGWSYGPPPPSHLSQLVLLGGLAELRKIDEMQGSYGKRLAVVKGFADTLAETTRINSLAFPDFYQSGYDPVISTPSTLNKNPVPSSSYTNRNRERETTLSTALESHPPDTDTPVQKSLDVPLVLLTQSMLSSLPAHIHPFLVGPTSILGMRIIDEKLALHTSGGVEDGEDNRDDGGLESPYAWVRRVMVESYAARGRGDDGDGDGDDGLAGGEVVREDDGGDLGI